MTKRSMIIGCGSYLPEKVLTNGEIAKMGIDTSDEWIVQRTGIRSRHIADAKELTSDLATKAAEKAIKSANIKPSEIDLIIVATTTPDNTFPAVAVKVQRNLGISGCPAFDVQAVCAGFIYALSVADNSLRLGQAKTALVIGAETLTRIVDWTDRSTCVLFGDGAGAVVLRAYDGRGDIKDRGVLATSLHTDGSFYDCLYTDGGPSMSQTSGHIKMKGQEVFKQAVIDLEEVSREALTIAGVKPEQVDWLVPHQANIRIIEGMAKKMGLGMDKVVVTVDKHGNTSAASIPLALAEAVDSGRLKPGHLVLMEAIGGGLSWGAALVRW